MLFSESVKKNPRPFCVNFLPDGDNKMLERISYGTDPVQFGELSCPAVSGPHKIAIVIHGGFWRSKYNLEYIRPVCESFVKAGIATWNLEYRRLGNPGGGWPGTLDDVAAGAAFLNSIAHSFNLDLNRVVAIGHSAGGHLALWLAARLKMLQAGLFRSRRGQLRAAWGL